jgi:peptidoglycan hydrolase-like protein with peptidoglycan-binding domain
MKIRLSDIQDDTAATSAEERLCGANGLEEARDAWKRGASVAALLGTPPYRLDAAVGAGKANRRSDVFAVELLLDEAGDLERAAGPSGIYDGKLEDAIRNFQRRHGLTDDGTLLEDGPTIRRLQKTSTMRGPNPGANAFSPVPKAWSSEPPAERNFSVRPEPRIPPSLEKYRDIIIQGKIDIDENARKAKSLNLLEFKDHVQPGGSWDYKNDRYLASWAAAHKGPDESSKALTENRQKISPNSATFITAMSARPRDTLWRRHWQQPALRRASFKTLY